MSNSSSGELKTILRMRPFSQSCKNYVKLRSNLSSNGHKLTARVVILLDSPERMKQNSILFLFLVKLIAITKLVRKNPIIFENCLV